MTQPPALHDGVTINATDQALQRVAICADTVAATFRGAADWLDNAAAKLGEVVYVAGTHLELIDGEDQPWQLSVFVYTDEFEAATKPALAR
jgi:hypothetical protein